ncbi:Protein LIPS-9 [Aphelenchoides avenae]|nr:Protein LIPS-9 [Aphelenchus avenae]
MKTAFFLLSILIIYVDANFHPNFRAFLRQRYGRGIERLLAREDYGPGGSFGGGIHRARTSTKHRPVIYVHGVGQIAGDLGALRGQLVDKHGYRGEEVFATSYGDLGRKSQFLVDPIKCEFVKQIRTLITVVSDYANSTVDVIGFSMGTPISRKAVLGGKCVDTKENLGKPLRDKVHSFLGIAGPNHGAFFCALLHESSQCNDVNGLSCASKFLADINLKKHYEGKYVNSLLTTKDEIVGHQLCGQITTQVPASDRTVTLTDQDHLGVLMNTVDIQYSLINRK